MIPEWQCPSCGVWIASLDLEEESCPHCGMKLIPIRGAM